MPVTSAGIVAYRIPETELEVILGRLGGPLWERREHWTIPKGIVEPGETEIAAAFREFGEETGWELPNGQSTPLGEIRQRSGKRVVAWAVEAEFDVATFNPGTFRMEWPPRSGSMGEFPELAEVRWLAISEAKHLITTAQLPLLERLEAADR